jgi:hypothetical protein
MKNVRSLLVLAASMVLSQSVAATAQQTNGLSPLPPADVEIPAGFPTNQNPINFFDTYSWRLFVSMVWPADVAAPGRPKASSALIDPGPLVFEMFKTNADTFQPAGAAPGPFGAVAPSNPCGPQAAQRDALVIAAFSKFEELQQAGFFGQLVGPIVSQNRRYVRYVTGYNQIAYDHIVANRLYLRASPAVDFPNGSIITKSALVEMDGIAHPERYYRRTAWIIDPATQICSEHEMGLVGLHIIQKTPSRPQWTWSTFEHFDNVPDRLPPPAAATFHNGSSTAMPMQNPHSEPTAQVPDPFNIIRVTPIHQDTMTTNGRMRDQLAQLGSVWQFYRLVMTQWPLAIASPQVPGSPPNTFPGTGATSAFANTTMETFDQRRISTGCMACHEDTHRETDFVWSVNTHAFPRIGGSNFFIQSARARQDDAALVRLRQRMEQAN